MAVAAGAASHPHSTVEGAVWLEILPFFLDAGGIRTLRATGGRSWRVPHAGDDVRQAVAQRLAAAGLDPVAVHSTSWRQERGAVLLTHLAVLRRPAADAEGLESWPVRDGELAYGSALLPPARIEVDHVVAHALRHLAWLALQDEAVRGSLSDGWREALRRFQAEPFRRFEGDRATA